MQDKDESAQVLSRSHVTSHLSSILLMFFMFSLAHALPIAIERRTDDDFLTSLNSTFGYQAVALGASGVIVACYKSLMAEGYTNSFTWGTDRLVGLGLCVTALVWNGVVVISGFFERGRPCRKDLMLCAARMVYLPHVLNATVFLWIVYSLSTKFRLSLWRPDAQYSRDAWFSAFKYRIPTIVNVSLASTVLFVSAGAIKAHDYTAAAMCVVGCAVYIMRAGGSTKFNDPDMPYKNHNFIRVLLPTDHKAGTLYMSGRDGSGLVAVWSYVWPNQIRESTERLVPALGLAGIGRSELPELRHVLRQTAISLVRCTSMDDDRLQNLARWLLFENPVQVQVEAQKKTMLVCGETFYFLYHAEMVLFTHRERLPTELRNKISQWRNIKASGASDIGDQHCYGLQGGIDGFRDALYHVALLFGQTAPYISDDHLPAPIYTRYDPALAEGYVGQIWSQCMEGAESVFAALYVFCGLRWNDRGADEKFPQFAIRAPHQEGDEIAQNTMWRQAWYSAVVAQLTASGVAISGAIVAGILGT